MPDLFDFAPYRAKEKPQFDLAEVTPVELRGYINAYADTMHAIIADATDADVVFVPSDPIARDIVTEETDAWTVGHVVVHVTASSEEAGALGLLLARDAAVPPELRSRYETLWTTITTAAQVTDRLEDSRRMCLAMLDAWPNPPHLDAVVEHSYFGKMNAVVRVMLGLRHADDHVEQLREIMRQAKAAGRVSV